VLLFGYIGWCTRNTIIANVLSILSPSQIHDTINAVRFLDTCPRSGLRTRPNARGKRKCGSLCACSAAGLNLVASDVGKHNASRLSNGLEMAGLSTLPSHAFSLQILPLCRSPFWKAAHSSQLSISSPPIPTLLEDTVVLGKQFF
jgi:hypothetical protein